MEFRKIIYFLKIAEEKSYSKAARELYVSPQTLSKQIQELESVLGYPLLIRTTVNVELTENGRVFYKEFAKLRNAWEEAWQRSLLKKQVKLGFFSHASQNGPQEEIIPFLTEQYPTWNIDVSAMDIPAIREKVLSGELDLVITSTYEGERFPGCESIMLMKEPACVYLPAGHPLSEQKEISLKDLYRTKVIFIKNTWVEPGTIFGKIKEFGEVSYISENYSLAQAIQTGKGIALLPQDALLKPYRGIEVRPLRAEDGFHYLTCLIFKKEHPLAEAFRKTGNRLSISD